MKTSVCHAMSVRNPLATAVRLVCLSALLCGPAAGLLSTSAVAQIPDAAQVPPAPLLDKPLPPSTPDTVGDQPSPQHVYVSGHWRWQDGAYVWESGHWETPPTPTAAWVAPRWEKKDNGFVLVEGFWQDDGADTAAATASAAEVVEVAPPPPEREIIYARPSPEHIWIGGYWGWHAGRHVWVGGRWDLPPRGGVVWVQPRWVRRGHGYAFVEGCWRDAGPRTTVVVASDGWRSDGIVTIAPPRPRFERRPPRPGFEFVWVDGYWGWHSRQYVWIGGRWDRPPHRHGRWEGPRWEHRHGGYVFVEGRWR